MAYLSLFPPPCPPPFVWCLVLTYRHLSVCRFLWPYQLLPAYQHPSVCLLLWVCPLPSVFHPVAKLVQFARPFSVPSSFPVVLVAHRRHTPVQGCKLKQKIFS